MYENKKSTNCSTPNRHPTCPNNTPARTCSIFDCVGGVGIPADFRRPEGVVTFAIRSICDGAMGHSSRSGAITRMVTRQRDHAIAHAARPISTMTSSDRRSQTIQGAGFFVFDGVMVLAGGSRPPGRRLSEIRLGKGDSISASPQKLMSGSNVKLVAMGHHRHFALQKKQKAFCRSLMRGSHHQSTNAPAGRI